MYKPKMRNDGLDRISRNAPLDALMDERDQLLIEMSVLVGARNQSPTKIEAIRKRLALVQTEIDNQ